MGELQQQYAPRALSDLIPADEVMATVPQIGSRLSQERRIRRGHGQGQAVRVRGPIPVERASEKGRISRRGSVRRCPQLLFRAAQWPSGLMPCGTWSMARRFLSGDRSDPLPPGGPVCDATGEGRQKRFIIVLIGENASRRFSGRYGIQGAGSCNCPFQDPSGRTFRQPFNRLSSRFILFLTSQPCRRRTPAQRTGLTVQPYLKEAARGQVPIKIMRMIPCACFWSKTSHQLADSVAQALKSTGLTVDVLHDGVAADLALASEEYR